MKKIIISCLLLCLCNAFGFAQEGLNGDATFHGTYFVITPEGQYATLYVEPYQEVMINEHRYRLYSGYFENIKYVDSLFLLRQDETKYFYYDIKEESEHLLFDFGLEKGDTYTDSFSGEEYEVTDVRDTLVSDRSQRLIELQSQGGKHDIWMEGIGSIYTGIMRPNDYCQEIYHLTSPRYFINGYDTEFVFYCFYPNNQYIKTAGMSFTEMEWEGPVPETEEEWKAYREWKYSPSDLNAEFIGDTLHIWGRLNASCVLQPYVACELKDNDVSLKLYSWGYVDCISNFKMEARIPGFKKDKYNVKLSWNKTIELECLGENPTSVKSISLPSQENTLFDLQGRKVSNPQKGIYIENGQKVLR